MTYEIPCTACESEGYFFFQGRLESCHKCKGWGVMDEEVEVSLWDGNTFIDIFDNPLKAHRAMVELKHPHLKYEYFQRNLNSTWNFGEPINA